VEANLALSCTACNVFKAETIAAFDELSQTNAQLFNPRQDSWEDHFRLERESGLIQGITASGRVTVTCLRINSTRQVEARLRWMRVGLYP
jgi:hypothetical protein